MLGPYPPAGPDWQKAIRKDVTQALTEVEMQSPDPQGLAEHWGKITGPGVGGASGEPELKLPNASFRFVKGASNLMSGLTFKVADIAKVRDAAKAKGCKVLGNLVRSLRRDVSAGGVITVASPLPLWERVDRRREAAARRVRGSLREHLSQNPLYLHGQHLCNESDLAPWPVATGPRARRAIARAPSGNNRG